MTNLKSLRDAKEKIENMGVEITSVDQHRNHLKIYVRYGTKERMFIKALTPSDRRAELNFLGDVKRWMRNQ